MQGMASLQGGAHHGVAALTHGEREAAQNALAKLKGPGHVLGSHLDSSTRSATVYSGTALKTTGLGASTVLHGQGHDTFIGGARSGLTPADAGNDTVVSGSTAATFGGRTSVSNALSAHGGHFSLSTDTISVAGTTAESVKAGHTDVTTSHATSHTITLADKTTVTITGVSAHDIGKLSH
jgi:hypothetical protein